MREPKLNFLLEKTEQRQMEVFFEDHQELIFGALKRARISNRPQYADDYQDWVQMTSLAFVEAYWHFPWDKTDVENYQKLKNYIYRACLWQICKHIREICQRPQTVGGDSVKGQKASWVDLDSGVEVIEIFCLLLAKLNEGELQYVYDRVVNQWSHKEMVHYRKVSPAMIYKRRLRVKDKYEALLRGLDD